MGVILNQLFNKQTESDWPLAGGGSRTVISDHTELIGGISNTSITNLTSVFNTSLEIVFSSEDTSNAFFDINVCDGSYSYTVLLTFGEIYDAYGVLVGKFSYPGSYVKIKLRITVSDIGTINVYVDDVLIPNAVTSVINSSSSPEISINGGDSAPPTVTCRLYYIKMNDQVLDPSDPLPDTKYSGGTLYCTNDDVRKAGDFKFYQEERPIGNEVENAYSLNLQRDYAFKIKELDKYTTAGGLGSQLTNVKFVPTSGQFSWIPPKYLKFGDSISSNDVFRILFQIHSSDEEINRARLEIQRMVDSVLNKYNITTPLTATTLYDQVIDITANLTKLKLLKDAGLTNKEERSEVSRQWDYYMNMLKDLSNLTLNGVDQDIINRTHGLKVRWQKTHLSDSENRRLEYNER